MERKIEKVFKRPANFGMVGDGFRVYHYIPGPYNIQRRMSPFLLLDFNPAYDFGKSDYLRGVDGHPHKGFETVTIAYKGAVAHHDSAGNSGVIHPGDVQWMTAGKGILHKEYHEQNFAQKGGDFEMVQLWVNLPAKDKLTTPKYQSLTAQHIPQYTLPNEQGLVNIIAGNFMNIEGAATTFSEVNLFDVKLKSGAHLNFDTVAAHNTAVLVIEGTAIINGENVNEHDFVLFSHEGENIDIQSKTDTVMLVMSGMPIEEPIASYGPFVMNTQAEIIEAIQEYQQGKFGTLN
jgi:redox-sensitive bicupin YhaK (pirin superfamily)